MLNIKRMLNAHALQSLIKPVDKPAKNLCVAEDESHKSVPLLIFTEQYLTQPKPELQPLNQIPYENMQKPGSGAVLSLEDFETQAFDMGTPFGGV